MGIHAASEAGRILRAFSFLAVAVIGKLGVASPFRKHAATLEAQQKGVEEDEGRRGGRLLPMIENRCAPIEFGAHLQKNRLGKPEKVYGVVGEVVPPPLNTIPVTMPAAAAPAPTPTHTQGMWEPARIIPPAPAPAPAPAASAPEIAV
jgi:hypothetical protein